MSFYRTFTESLDIPLATIVTAVALVLLTSIYYWIKNSGVLPGPKGLPYLGLYPFLSDENIQMKLEAYKQKYGDMFSFTFTGRLYINLGSIKAMREIQLQNSHCFADRFKDRNVLSGILINGLFFANGEKWKALRKFFIQRFKELGFSTVRGDSGDPIYDSLHAAIENLKAVHEKPVNITEFLSQYCSISLRKILFGENGVTDEEISKMVMAFASALEGLTSSNLLLMGPLAKFLSCAKPSFRKNRKHASTLNKLLLHSVKRIESSMDENATTCIVEEFYKEKNKRMRSNDISWKYFSDEALVESLFQFVGDGITSVTAFIADILNSLLKYPEEQEKLYSEIMDVIGPNRQPALEDRPNLPYTNAFLSECIRVSNFLICFPSLECTKETTVRGYRIPKGAITLLNFSSAHFDEEAFEDPHSFKPSRYLHSEGKPKVESPVMFGMGKRICTGESFVMLQSFLFLTTIVKYFKVVASNAPKDKTLDFLYAGKLELTFAPRKEI